MSIILGDTFTSNIILYGVMSGFDSPIIYKILKYMYQSEKKTHQILLRFVKLVFMLLKNVIFIVVKITILYINHQNQCGNEVLIKPTLLVSINANTIECAIFVDTSLS